MAARDYQSRLKADYRKAFGTSSGKHVLMDLYTHSGGKNTSWPQSGNAFELAFNEGKRWIWLRIMELMREEDMEMRKMLEKHIQERQREESSQ